MEHRVIELAKGTFCGACGEDMYAAGPECVTADQREEVLQKVRRSEGRMLVVWSPQECEAMKDLLRRLRRLE
jgi:L-2-hydroxyglutarate oxidase LhgO